MAVDSLGSKRQPQFLDGGAPDVAVDPTAVADYAAEFGNYVADTDAKRVAASWAWAGLMWFCTDTKIAWLHDGAGWSPAGGQLPRVILSRNATAFSVPNAVYTQVAGTYLATTKQVDATTSGGAITIVTGGEYDISVSATFAANANGGRQILVNRNSTSAGTNPLVFAGSPATATAPNTVAARRRVALVAGDVLRFHIYQNSGSSIPLIDSAASPDQALGTFFEVAYVGPA